ncbi:hypothetical protein CPU12_00665 [Malaciobacter molluscorum LMG 25693]|uniref:Transcriptional regulator, ModE family n=1 Tax=Malaciobacter molluscorum LMG 25693 TaxID=870501 RepID=A0A2G1DLE0_9BACT|nr:hypothetical protein [Malaciobacter molluscorum]AXX92094.1 putative transcriptional regulator, ModE family [Malaciobacter molluscorum LMG 25693]PHO19322.1 hypothetical protein CPU12_00665 [Malaciobacter molluscorum LMG 25693]RXJ96417.1 hypothetical protein CRV00_02015 [Malaciobacter molluscorum]
MENKYNIGGQIWVQKDGGNFMGPGRIKLLEKLIVNSNLKIAAQEANIDYDIALKNIKAINKIANEPLAIKQADENSYEITLYGKKIIDSYNKLKKEHEKLLLDINKRFIKDIES